MIMHLNSLDRFSSDHTSLILVLRCKELRNSLIHRKGLIYTTLPVESILVIDYLISDISEDSLGSVTFWVISFESFGSICVGEVLHIKV